MFDYHLNPVMLVFIRQISLSTLKLVPMCQGYSHYSAFLHHFVLAKLVTSRIRVKHIFKSLVNCFSWFRLGSTMIFNKTWSPGEGNAYGYWMGERGRFKA